MMQWTSSFSMQTIMLPILRNSNAKGEFPLKLVIKANKVLFAEAGKELVDFLFGLLSVPLGSVVALLGKQSVPGSIGTLYKSIEDLGSTFFSGGSISYNRLVKNEILNPPLPSCRLNEGACRLPWESTPTSSILYKCNRCNDFRYVSNYEARCPSCPMSMTGILTLLQSDGHTGQEREEGFVKGVMTYTITDDLSINPLSTISSFGLMNKLKVNDLDSLEEKTVMVGVQQGIQILKIALQSRTVLSDVFLPKVSKGHN